MALGLVVVIIVVVVGIVVIVPVMRGFWLRFFRINEIVDLLTEIRDSLRK